jgi:hemimethylated DNA binding protein
LHSSQLGIDKLFPRGSIPATIQTNEDFQGIVYDCFKHLPECSENIDIGFKVLKVLNDYNQILRDKSLQRQIHSNPIFYQHAKFKVGQVVMNKYTKVRGVVTGWDVDAARGSQEVELLVDTLDYQEFTVQRGTRFNKMVNSDNLELVEDMNLQRIHNTGLNSLFFYFDESSRRYVPKPDLVYLYPQDFEGVEFQNALIENERSQHAMKRITEGVQTLGKHMQVIVDEYFPDLVTVSSGAHHEAADQVESDEQINEITIARQILEEISIHIDSMIKPHPSLKTAPSSAATTSLARQLLRGGLHRNSRNESASNTVNDKIPTNKFEFKEEDQIKVETAYGALFSLQEFMTSLFQILQLRFQSKGITFSDQLFVNPDNKQNQAIELQNFHSDVESLVNQAHYPIAIYEVGQVIRHKKYNYRGVISGYDHRPILDVSKWDGVQGLKLGQEQPFYRVVPDQRDTEEFLGPGSHRPYFYVAQENIELLHDPVEMVSISHRNIGQYFLGWDHERSRFRLPHQLKYCFPAGHHALPEDYPRRSILKHWQQQQQSDLPIISNAEETENMELLRRKIIQEEIQVYEKIDELLLDLFAQVKRVLSEIREQHIINSAATVKESENKEHLEKTNQLLFSVSDIMTLLKHAPTKEAALPVESVHWYIWTTNSDPNIAALLRLGMSYMKRNDKTNAVACYKLATELAPKYAEAHNKLAAIYHAQEMHLDCLEASAKALTHFPEHYGALAGQGLSYEKLGKSIIAWIGMLSLNSCMF